MPPAAPYVPKHKIRVVTAASLFDGHDAAINVMRRVLQSMGAEVIHLGHNRSVQEVVGCAIQEDAQAIALTSYQGGHVEYFKYMVDLLKERGCGHVKIFGGGGGVILPQEMKELHAYGVTRLYSPDDGRAMGLVGMIADLLSKCDFAAGEGVDASEFKKLKAGMEKRDPHALGRLISAAENDHDHAKAWLPEVREQAKAKRKAGMAPVLGITGTGGAGKSSLVDELVRRFLRDFSDKAVAVLAVDPSRRKTGGALLGDRIRMNAISDPRVYMRSMATRQSDRALSGAVDDALAVLEAAGFDLIILESSGIGQSDTEITRHSDVAMYVMTPEYGAATQLEKIDMLDFADLVALNKFDKRGAADALRDVCRQVKRNRQAFDSKDEDMPVYGTIASQFNDPGMNRLYRSTMDAVAAKTGAKLRSGLDPGRAESEKIHILPPSRTRYLSDITDTIRTYDAWSVEQSKLAQAAFALNRSAEVLREAGAPQSTVSEVEERAEEAWEKLEPECRELLETWPDKVKKYTESVYRYEVRGRTVEVQTHTESLSRLAIPKISLPRYEAWGDLLRWNLQENVPGEFPYASGVFPFKRENEDPTRMFAGEGGPERTNRRFHYVSRGMPAKRLSTAFDSVTLYGEDPDHRPDIYGKIGNAGVSVCCLDDAKKLYSGFDLADPSVSVSMTINGPAPVVTGFYLNAAIDQQCEKWIKAQGKEKEIRAKLTGAETTGRAAYQGSLPEGNDGLGLMLLGTSGDRVLEREVYERIKDQTLQAVRGTVQADILKEDQAQNTCIFSTEFSLRLMGDLQQYFIQKSVRNFYSVSISGYHIAEAGANPISQLAFTLANGFTYVEYYLSRGMKIDDFAPNLSFFFSNGVDPEYTVIGRVARRIWAKAMKHRYGASARSQLLKYHIQTSGRSLHAQEIDFNDIRTTLQAAYAIFDNCNSLHTNAYDEAITTPTEESVRRAIAIQLIINQELGLAKNQNPNQGSFIIEELTELVEEAVLLEFDRLTERGGVLGAMETMYQRSKIQEESLYYETLKHSGKLPVVGVNTFLSSTGSPTILPREVIRSTKEEKEFQVNMVRGLQARNAAKAKDLLKGLQAAATSGKNAFESIMDSTRYCSLGQITGALYEVGGQYRRNM
ncbi:MAG TPA: methylmalonyl-CoA mutase family protein [Bdellovibrionota bacterium]|nr:methylmalonyl-CoA mutase family protein [Bdellovibrionota bacterium]